MKIYCNVVKRVKNMKGSLQNYGDVWYSEKAIASILSLEKLTDIFSVKYNRKRETSSLW